MMEAPLSASSKLSGASGWTGPRASRSCPSYEGAARRTPEPLRVPGPSLVQSPGGCAAAPPGPSPPGGSLPEIAPRHRLYHGGWRRSEGNPYPTHPRTRSTKREDHPWADCRVVCGIRKTLCGEKKNHEVIRESGYLRSRQGLGPWRPILVVITGVGGAVQGKSLSLLGPFGLPRWGSLPFLSSPRWGRGLLLLLLAFVGGV